MSASSWHATSNQAAGCSAPAVMLQGLDWRDSRAAACNANVNPIQVHISCWCVQSTVHVRRRHCPNLLSAYLQHEFNDGLSVDPFEVIFIKVSHVISFELCISDKDHLRRELEGCLGRQQRLHCWLLGWLPAHLL